MHRHAELDRLVREKESALQMCKEVSDSLYSWWSLHALTVSIVLVLQRVIGRGRQGWNVSYVSSRASWNTRRQMQGGESGATVTLYRRKRGRLRGDENGSLVLF